MMLLPFDRKERGQKESVRIFYIDVLATSQDRILLHKSIITNLIVISLIYTFNNLYNNIII